MNKTYAFSLIFIFLTILTGCTAEEEKQDKITTATCTETIEGEMTETFIYRATNDEIDKVKLTIVYDNLMFNTDTLSTFTEEQKEQVKSNVLTNLGLDAASYEGLEITIDIQDEMTLILDVDLKKADPEILKKVGLDFEDTDMSLKRAIKDMTSDGAICTE